MIGEVQKLVDNYINWLKDKTALRQVEGWVEITTPYLDRHNDYIQIYVRRLGDRDYVITDDGYTINDLRASGCELNTEKRQELLRTTLNGFGVRLEEYEALTVRASPANFSAQKHNLVQAVLAVDDMFYLASPTVRSLFYEDVINWLDRHDIRFTPQVRFTGKSGYDHHFDFVVPKSRRQPERIIQTINRPTRSNTEAVAFAWVDTREVRPADSKAYAFLNDEATAPSPLILEALQNYEMQPVAWSKRSHYVEELAT